MVLANEEGNKHQSKPDELDSLDLSLSHELLGDTQHTGLEDEEEIKEKKVNTKKVEFWASQDPDGSKARAKRIKELEEKKREEEEKIRKQMAAMSQAEAEKVKHLALQKAQQELDKKNEESESLSKDELLEFEEKGEELEDWESVKQYSQFMQQKISEPVPVKQDGSIKKIGMEKFYMPFDSAILNEKP